MDRQGFSANTDIIVVVDPPSRRLLWMPRDLWCESLGDRINAAYRKGGHGLLKKALAEYQVVVNAGLCLARQATEHALAQTAIVVPVPERMTFHYPLTPTSRIEDGRKTIEFNPPAEMLRGERVHQWIGARGSSDLHRIERQKVFLRRLLDTRFNFRGLLQTPSWFSGQHLDQAICDLGQVRTEWQFDTFGPLQNQILHGKKVLVREE